MGTWWLWDAVCAAAEAEVGALKERTAGTGGFDHFLATWRYEGVLTAMTALKELTAAAPTTSTRSIANKTEIAFLR